MSSETLHEDANKLGFEVIDQHRAIVSLMEELEAADWYNQRAKATDNTGLRTTDGPILEIEAEMVQGGDASERGGEASADGGLGIGSLRKEAAA